MSSFKRHAASQTHKEAVIQYLFRRAGHAAANSKAGSCLPGAAPAVVDFANAWKRLALRESDQPGRRKLRTLEWCLFEAIRDREHDFLQAARCMSIATDERNGRLLVKYAASNDNLDVQYGCLALLRDAGSNAHDIAAAVHRAVSSFCTRRAIHPALNTPRAQLNHCGQCNASLQKHILDRIEMFTADGAANEQLAAKMLHPASLRSSLCQKLPNLRMILRDRAHATRRLTERTFQADSKLDRIMRVVVLGETSVARLLKNSRQLQCMFEEEVSKQARKGNAAGVQGSIRNMSFAKQRFDSTAKPLGRCLLNLDATISTMDLICQQRPAASKEHKGALQFLQLLSEPQNVVLMGMLADASDECLVLTRFFDREAFRVEEMSEQLAGFKQRLRQLFAEKGCLTMGYTSLALEHLRHTKLLPIPGRGLVELGGSGSTSPESVTECLGHMVAWSRLAEEVANTEFPEFELLACFRVFRLAAPQPEARSSSKLAASMPMPSLARTQNRDLERLATAFKVDTARLFDQFKEHVPIVQAELRRAPEVPAATAWQRAIQRTQATKRRRHNFPAETLHALLQRFAVAPGSTAGIEQNFSMFKRHLGEHWQGSPEAEERQLVLELARAALPTPDEKLLGAARLIWSCTFGAPRIGRPGKLRRQATAHLRQLPLHDAPTAAAWLRRRRQEAAAAAAAATVTPATTPITDQALEAAAIAAWTARHEKEACFQQAARDERQRAAVQEGVLPIEALGHDAEQKMAAFHAQERDRQIILDARLRLRAKTLQPPQAPALYGCQVFVDEEATAALQRWPSQWQLKLRQEQLRLVQDRAVAQVFVTVNPSAPGGRIRCVAAMTGAVLCTPEFLLTPPGVVVQLKRGLSLPRHIFVSQACQGCHPGMIDLMRRVCQLTEKACRWTWYLEADGAQRQQVFLSRARKRGRNHRQEMVTLLAPGQIRDAAFQAFPNCMTVSSFLVAIHRVDARFTQLGFCKR